MGNWLGWIVSPFARKRKREGDDYVPPPPQQQQQQQQQAPAPVAVPPEDDAAIQPGKKQKKNALPKRGGKLANMEDTEAQQKVVADARAEWVTQIDTERSCSIRSISVAKWRPELGLAEVTSVKGKWNQAMGFTKDGAQWLQPEEAVFLVDQGALELYYGGTPLTVQEVFAILAQCNISWDRYFTYANLKRAGYIVIRSSIYRLKRDRDVQNKAREAATKAAAANATTAEVVAAPPIPAAATPPATANAELQTLPSEPAPLSLPLNLSPDHDGEAAKPKEVFTAQPRIPGDFAPLADIRNSDADILRQLQIIPRVTYRESPLGMPVEPTDLNSPALCVDFDVYDSNSKYKKANPGVPAFRVAVCPFTEAVPPLNVIEPLCRLAHPAPLKIAVVYSGIVLYNEFVSMRTAC